MFQPSPRAPIDESFCARRRRVESSSSASCGWAAAGWNLPLQRFRWRSALHGSLDERSFRYLSPAPELRGIGVLQNPRQPCPTHATSKGCAAVATRIEYSWN